MNERDKIFVTGHAGLVGSAIVRQLKAWGYTNIITAPRAEVDLTNAEQARWFFSCHQPDYVFHCAAWVGGIMAHLNYSTEAILANCAMQNNVIPLAAEYGAKKLLFLGSACAYPRAARTPISEDSLGTGALEPSNKGYALCKMLGTELCQAMHRERGFCAITGVPTNVYGLNDKYDLQKSHVIPGMIHRMHLAKTTGAPHVLLWGTGDAVREFIWADDLARACVMLMERYDDPSQIVNLGSGEWMPLKAVALKVAKAVGFTGEIIWDNSKPDGTPVRFLDNSRIFSLGCRPQVYLNTGLPLAYTDFLNHQ